jgi:acylphosphatase
MQALHATVRGMVQGVGFRYSALSSARRLGLEGWVRNNFDGSVETRAIGEPGDIDAYLTWLGEGPPHARVDAVHISYRGEARESDRDLAGNGFTVTF